MNNSTNFFPSKDDRGELLFRFLANAATGIICSLYVIIFLSLLGMISFIIFPEKGFDLKLGDNKFTQYSFLFFVFLISLIILILPNFLAWFFSFPYPLKKYKQT